MKKALLLLIIFGLFCGTLTSCRGVRDMNGYKKSPVKGGGWI